MDAETVGGEESIPFTAQRCNDATERAEENLVLLCYQLPVTNLGLAPSHARMGTSFVSIVRLGSFTASSVFNLGRDHVFPDKE